MWSARTCLLGGGCLPGNFTIEEKKVDYKKYLGPDWKASFEKPTAIVCNHQSWLDIMVNMYQQSPSHVAKEATKNIPFVGKCSEMYGCLFIKRGDKDSKRDMFTQIAERQIEIEKGLYPPLIFYAEGGTSNGKQLLQFKQGGFFSLKSVQPQIITYESRDVDLENCIIKIQSIAAFMASCGFSTKIKAVRLPVFEPNDYFFQNHQKEGEEKWQTFARVIRDIMSEVSGLEKSDLSIEDKFAYKKLLYGSKKEKLAD